MKKILELLLKEPITTIQGLLYGLVGVLSFYSVITTEEGSLWVMFLLAIFKIFSRDTTYNTSAPNQKNTSRRVASLEIGGGVGGPAVKPKKT
jgi:hypothetical protein